MRGRRLVAALLAVLIVAQAAVVPAAAATSSDGCEDKNSLENKLEGVVAGFTLGLVYGEEYCTKVDRIEEASDKTEAIHLYQHGIDESNDFSLYLSTFNNYFHDSKSIANQNAKWAIAQAYLDGAGKVEAQVRAEDAVKSYYSRMQVNYLEFWSQFSAQIAYIADIARNDSGISNRTINIVDLEHYNGGWGAVNGDAHFTGDVVDANVTLVNGTTYTFQAAEVVYDQGNDGGELDYGYWSPIDSEFTNVYYDYNGNDYRVQPGQINIRGPTTDYPVTPIFWKENREMPFNKIDSFATNLADKLNEGFVENIYDAFNNGTVDPKEVYSADTLVRKASGDANASSAKYLLATLASLGLKSPDLGNTTTMLVNYTGRWGSIPRGDIVATVKSIGSSPDTLDYTIQTGFNLSRSNRSVATVWITYSDGTQEEIPYSNWERTDMAAGNVSISGYTPANTSATIANVSVGVLKDETEVEWVRNKTIEGLLFSESFPGSVLYANRTYETPKVSGQQMIAVLGSENASVKPLVGSFTVTAIYTAEGEKVDSINWTQYSYQTFSSTNFVEQTQMNKRMIKQIDDRSESGGGGGSGGTGVSLDLGGSWGGLGAVVLIGAGVVVFLLGSRD